MNTRLAWNYQTKFLLAALLAIMSLSAPALSAEVKLKQVIARCQAKLATQEAVLLSFDPATEQYLVIAARNKRLEGQIVRRKHIIGKTEAERTYLYYKDGSRTPDLKLPYLEDELSIEESMAMKQHYAAKGKITLN